MLEFVGEMCNHFIFFMIICYVDVGRVKLDLLKVWEE